jgi:alpha-amylase
MIVRSVDQTADKVHVFLDLPANMSDAEILQRAEQGFNKAGYYDRDSFILGFSALPTGNHVATIVTFEPTETYSIKRHVGLFTDTDLGAGFGDMNNNGIFTIGDIRGTTNGSVEDILYSQNDKFRAAFDVNGDGLGDNRDLFALGDELISAGAGQAVLNAYTDLLLHRADVNSSATSDTADIAALYANFGSSSWLFDINVDGVVDIGDISAAVTTLFRTTTGDFNVDGSVDAADYVLWRNNHGVGDARFTQGDGDLDGDVDNDDLLVWRSQFGFIRQSLTPTAANTMLASVPEPGALFMAASGLVFLIVRVRSRATSSPRQSLGTKSKICVAV